MSRYSSGMSYSFTVKADGNTLTVESQTTEIPDGYYQVNGHEEPAWLSIGVLRQDPAHVQIIQATAYGKHPQES